MTKPDQYLPEKLRNPGTPNTDAELAKWAHTAGDKGGHTTRFRSILIQNYGTHGNFPDQPTYHCFGDLCTYCAAVGPRKTNE